MNVQLIIPAAGMGTRLGFQRPKALIPLGSDSLLIATLKRMLATEKFDLPPIITIPEEFHAQFADTLSAAGLHARLVAGGVERQDSVRLALEATPPDAALVAIHDAARPFVPISCVLASLEQALLHGAATVALPVTDTILSATPEGMLDHTPDRAKLWACQTPQSFRLEVIRSAHQRALAESFRGTDDATLVRHFGGAVKLVMGHAFNIKITHPEDLQLAAWIREQEESCTA